MTSYIKVWVNAFTKWVCVWPLPHLVSQAAVTFVTCTCFPTYFRVHILAVVSLGWTIYLSRMRGDETTISDEIVDAWACTNVLKIMLIYRLKSFHLKTMHLILLICLLICYSHIVFQYQRDYNIGMPVVSGCPISWSSWYKLRVDINWCRIIE